MNTTGRKTVKANATAGKSVKATGVGMAAQIGGASPSYETIAKRSYEIYLGRGSQPGHEVEDWLAAEAELTAKLH